VFETHTSSDKVWQDIVRTATALFKIMHNTQVMIFGEKDLQVFFFFVIEKEIHGLHFNGMAAQF